MRYVGLLLAFSAIAGCSASDAGDRAMDPATPVYAPPELDDNTGAIDGLAVDDEHAPIARAAVLLDRSGPQTETDEAGRFAFGRVAPGEHILIGAALGRESVAVRAVVVAGETTKVTLVLPLLPTNETRPETTILKGKTTCSVSYRSPANFVRPTCSLAGPAFPNDKWNIQYPVKANFHELLVETSWSATYAWGDYLLQIVRPQPFVSNIREVEAKSPIRIPVNHTSWVEWDEKNGQKYTSAGGIISLSTFAAHNILSSPSPVELGLLVDQTFTVYSTASYNGPLPDRYTSLPDG